MKVSTSPLPDGRKKRSCSWRRKLEARSAHCAARSGANPELLCVPPGPGTSQPRAASVWRSILIPFVRPHSILNRWRPETLLARSLNMRLDQQCFDKPSTQQAPCLTQNTDQLVLDEPTVRPWSRLSARSIQRSAGTGQRHSDGGRRILQRLRGRSGGRGSNSRHDAPAQYQYIPALALPKKDNLNLRLNTPPSFRNPKSVITIALPLVLPAANPPLRAIDATQVFASISPLSSCPPTGLRWYSQPSWRTTLCCTWNASRGRESIF